MAGQGPVKVINFGAVQVSIWSSEYKGQTNYSVKVSKRYLKDGKWTNTEFLNKNDALAAALGLQEAYKAIAELSAGSKTTDSNTNDNEY